MRTDHFRSTTLTATGRRGRRVVRRDVLASSTSHRGDGPGWVLGDADPNQVAVRLVRGEHGVQARGGVVGEVPGGPAAGGDVLLHLAQRAGHLGWGTGDDGDGWVEGQGGTGDEVVEPRPGALRHTVTG